MTWLGTFAVALLLCLVAMAALGLGLLLGRDPPRGSCGGACGGPCGDTCRTDRGVRARPLPTVHGRSPEEAT